MQLRGGARAQRARGPGFCPQCLYLKNKPSYSPQKKTKKGKKLIFFFKLTKCLQARPVHGEGHLSTLYILSTHCAQARAPVGVGGSCDAAVLLLWTDSPGRVTCQ